MRVTDLAAAVSLAALAACSPHGGQNANANVMLADDSLMANDLSADEGDMNTVTGNSAAALPTDAATFISTAAASDLFETQSSRLALTRSKDKAVRDFAQMMITDHARTTAGLEDAAKKANMTVPPPVLSTDQQQMMAALQPLGGGDFDTVYIRQQLTGHQQARALMQNYAESGDTPALRDAARTAISIVRKHLARLQELAKQGG